MHHLNKTLILKSKLNCAISSSKSCFYKCSLYPGRHGHGDTIDFQRPDHLFVVNLAWSVLGLERRILFGHSCHVPLQLPAPYDCSLWLACKVLIQCTWVTSTPPQKWWFSFPGCSQRHEHNLQRRLPYCQHSQLQVWKSGKMSWKYCFFLMHSCSSCSSNILKTFSLSKCIFTYLHFRFMLLPIHFTFCITLTAYFNCLYLGLTRAGGKWG